MYMVFWTENGQVSCREFGNDEMSKALEFTQTLRTAQYSGEHDIRYITMAVEDPNMVGKLGYDVTGPDYDWKKRRT